jgi:transposase
MAEAKEQGCPGCARLQQRIEELEARLAKLEAELVKARKNSSNSSKPPSSDIVNALRKGRARSKRRRGGQPGHPRHERPPFSEEQIHKVQEYRYSGCPCCGGELQEIDLEPKKLQQVELVVRPIRVVEHRRVAQRCVACQRVHYAELPAELVKAGLVGPRLTALVGFLKGACHMSFSSIRKFLRDVVGLTISRGQLRNLVAKVSDSLQDPYEELLGLLPEQERLNVDETGHKDNGHRLWTWCFRAAMFTLYKISPSRGSDVLLDVLGEEFDGVIGCDYFGAYRKYMRLHENVALQFCLAHLIRDVKFLAEHPDARNRTYGARLLEHLRQLFRTIHRRDAYASPAHFRRALERVRDELVWDATMESPHTSEALNLEERFYQHTESYFRFISTPNVEATNNLAEQVIRFVAIHRRLTQGTRGAWGQTWCERIWTIIATCAQQGRSVFGYLLEALLAHFACRPAPSLASNTS